ncbi:uncharacterized protein B0T23DRAFT_305773 [Neurospora hispaniola]|uniref:Uncharacterized protein n=1 Tax=Neurospora hispaniola TaxID=588809 RepID=A0AAJ0MVH3_9PEZI|nr:hypothetical protein B0T23DRAFT_305773 [Neurospora hispaniola]
MSPFHNLQAFIHTITRPNILINCPGMLGPTLLDHGYDQLALSLSSLVLSQAPSLLPDSLAMRYADDFRWFDGVVKSWCIPNRIKTAPMKDAQEMDTCPGYRLSDDVHLRAPSDVGC